MTFENIKNQIMKILCESDKTDIRVSSLLSQLDFSFINNESINSKFPMPSIIKLYLFRLIKGLKNYEALKKYLIENESEAFKLGLYKDENNNLLIPPKRTYNYYLQTKITPDEKHELNLIVEKILDLATKHNIIFSDILVVEKAIKEKKKSHKREIREAVKLIKKLVYPKIDLNLYHNAKFTNQDFLDVLTYIASKNYYANDGSKLFDEDNNYEKKIPSGDLMFHHFSKFDSITKLKDMFDKILDVIFDYCKRNYNVLQFRKLDIAYDITDIHYYGKQMSHVCGGKHDRGTSRFFKFLTCSIVVAGKRFVLDVVPIHQLNSIDKLIDVSLARVKGKIKIAHAYLDRGFDKPNIINVLKKHNIKFIMPKCKSCTVKAWFNKSEAIKSRVIHDFQIGTGNNKAIVNLVLINDEDGVKRAFFCNFDIAPQLAYRLFGMYSKRWGVETAYRNLKHDFKPKTTTKNYNIRLFYFLFSTCLYNLWILVNISVSLAVYGRIKEKPIITAKMLVMLLYKVQAEYFEGDG